MWKVNLEKFKEATSKYDKPVLKALLWEFSFQRILCELVLADAINTCRKNGDIVPKTETLEDYSNSIETERILINILGRKEAAKVYGVMEGITSAMKTVDYILENGAIEHYKKLIASSVMSKNSGGC